MKRITKETRKRENEGTRNPAHEETMGIYETLWKNITTYEIIRKEDEGATKRGKRGNE